MVSSDFKDDFASSSSTVSLNNIHRHLNRLLTLTNRSGFILFENVSNGQNINKIFEW